MMDDFDFGGGTGGGSSSSKSTSQSTQIINGKKVTTIKHTITHPDGSTETKTEKRVESC